MIIRFLSILALLVTTAGLRSQTITLRLPFFEGAPYVWIFFQGSQQDTVVRGIIPVGGEVKLVVPNRFAGYAGMTRWMLTHSEGGGMDIIVNKEEFIVECSERYPSRENIHFAGTLENPFMDDLYFEKQNLLRKADAMQNALESYKPTDPLYTLFQNELDSLKKRFATIQRNTSESPLYVARFREIVDFTVGIADQLYATDQERAMALDSFFTNKLDWNALYTSGHWDHAIQIWVEMNVYAIKSDLVLLQGTRNIFNHITDKKVYTDFAIQVVRYFTRHNKDQLLSAISSEVRHSGRLLHMKGALMVFAGLQQGDFAIVPTGITASAQELYCNGAVVLFYDSDCSNCELVKAQLINDYKTLKDKGIRVISISSDQDPDKNNRTLSQFPWPDKLSDFLGKNDGENYAKWGVLGTPTLFVINRKGIITGRYATFNIKDILSQIE